MTGRTGRIVVAVALLMSLTAMGCKKQADEKAVPGKSTETLGKPVIVAVEPVYDFGKVKQGEEVAHTYLIKNTGDRDLVIEKTSGS